MTPNEIITAGISGLALIVAGLALIYSRRSAAAAQKSADAAQRANDLMAKQLELATDEQKRQQEKDRSESCPRFIWRGGNDAPMVGKCERDFENQGGEISDLSIQTDRPDVLAEIYPINFLKREGTGSIKFAGKSGKLSRPVGFRISCKTKIGDHWEKAYKIMDSPNLAIVEA